MKKTRIFSPVVIVPAVFWASSALAQSSVTLFGIVDTGITYVSSQGAPGSNANGHSNIRMDQGIWNGSQFGIRGSEDLGAGTSVFFNLINKFNSATGGLQYANAEFGHQAYVGVTNPNAGSVTLGRVFTSYYWMLAPYSPNVYLTGFSGAHPGDIDNLDTSYRTDNTVTYTSPTVYGLTFSAGYSLGGVPGSLKSGASWSAGARYVYHDFGIAAGFERFNNSNAYGGVWGGNSTAENGGEPGVSALTYGYRTAAAQQRFAIAGGYEITGTLGLSVSYSNVQFVPGGASTFRSVAIWNTLGAVLHYRVTPDWTVAAGYSFTESTKSNGVSSAARYNQITLTQFHALSKRTGIYALEAYTRASGQTLGADGVSRVDATATIGDGFNGTPSTGRSQFAATLGINHKF